MDPCFEKAYRFGSTSTRMSRGAIEIDWPIQSDEKTWGQEKGHVERLTRASFTSSRRKVFSTLGAKVDSKDKDVV